MVSHVRPADKQAHLNAEMYEGMTAVKLLFKVENYAKLQSFYLQATRAINCASEIEMIS